MSEQQEARQQVGGMPQIGQLIPGIAPWAEFTNVAALIVMLISSVEGNEQMNGEQKKAFVVNAAFATLKVTEALEGDLFDDAAFKEAVGDFVDAYVAAKNLMGKLQELNTVANEATNRYMTALMAWRAARIEKAQPKIVTAAPKLELVSKMPQGLPQRPR